MKLLLDENLPRQLKNDLRETHEVFTVRDMGWLGQKNGKLLGLLVLNGFDGLITIDKNLIFQQNLQRFELRFFVINAVGNRYQDLLPFVPNLSKILQNPPENQIIELEIN